MYPLSTRDKYCGFRTFLTYQSLIYLLAANDLYHRLPDLEAHHWTSGFYRRSGNRHRRVWRWAGTKTHQSDSGLPQASDIQPHNSRWAQFPLDKFPITNFRVRTAVWTRRDKCTEIPCFQGFYGTRVQFPDINFYKDVLPLKFRLRFRKHLPSLRGHMSQHSLHVISLR